ELRAAHWLDGALPRMYSVQSEGCAPVVRAYTAGDTEVAPWENPETLAAGLRVPAPFGGKLMLRALRESGGGAVAVSDSQMLEEQRLVAARDGLDLAPEGAATVAALKKLVASESIGAGDTVVLFNTGAGWLYRL
ncbi:MAG: pyridoxal-phosphate dependent enzyme, partial [Gemmatimonadetes bacterium]|nr:pyridoxal-phosphate dependent enzyme [Gemmatimonadota bacterium]